MLVSIVIPCYYSEATIRKEVEMIFAEFAGSKYDGYDCEIVLVNDGSKDGTYEEITKLSEEFPQVKGINLMKNFGQHNALMAGLNYAEGDLIMGMDDDLQTHPSQMIKLIEKIGEGYDLVYGVYPELKTGALKQLTSKLNKTSSRIMLNRPKEIKSSNFWIITKPVRDEVIKHKAFNPYVDAIFYQTTHNIGMVDVEHFERAHGTSGYTFRKLMRLWVTYWNFSVVPLRISFILGVSAAVIGLLLIIFVIINKILYPDVTAGWSSLMCVMILLFGAVLMVLGIVGEYLGKIIMILNDSPQYIVRDSVNIDEEHR